MAHVGRGVGGLPPHPTGPCGPRCRPCSPAPWACGPPRPRPMRSARAWRRARACWWRPLGECLRPWRPQPSGEAGTSWRAARFWALRWGSPAAAREPLLFMTLRRRRKRHRPWSGASRHWRTARPALTGRSAAPAPQPRTGGRSWCACPFPKASNPRATATRSRRARGFRGPKGRRRRTAGSKGPPLSRASTTWRLSSAMALSACCSACASVPSRPFRRQGATRRRFCRRSCADGGDRSAIRRCTPTSRRRGLPIWWPSRERIWSS